MILYGDNNNWFAAYAFWLLKYYGHSDVRLINGGRKKWIAEGKPLSADVPRYGSKTYRVSKIEADLRALREFVAGASRNRRMVWSMFALTMNTPERFLHLLDCRNYPCGADIFLARRISHGLRQSTRMEHSNQLPTSEHCMKAKGLCLD